MAIDYLDKRAKADRQIRRWGQQAKLKRGSDLRDCWALEVQLSTHERAKLKNPTSRVFIISATGLAVPPSDRLDALVWNEDGTERTFRQTAPVAPLQPGGVIIYYEIQVE